MTKFVVGFETVSFDVAAGVVGSAYFVTSLCDAKKLSLPILFALGATVLVVYNFDHFLDSFQIAPHSTLRRRGYLEHRAWLLLVLIVAALGGAISLVFLPSKAWIPGMVLAAYQAAYFLGLKLGLRGVAKRLSASLGWAAGVSFPAWIDPSTSRTCVAFAGAIFAALAWINLQSYAVAEDLSENDPSKVPGLFLRGLAIAIALALIGIGFWTRPDHLLQWMALLAVAFVQIGLTRIPLRFVHPVGEWSLALLGWVTRWRG